MGREREHKNSNFPFLENANEYFSLLNVTLKKKERGGCYTKRMNAGEKEKKEKPSGTSPIILFTSSSEEGGISKLPFDPQMLMGDREGGGGGGKASPLHFNTSAGERRKETGDWLGLVVSNGEGGRRVTCTPCRKGVGHKSKTN